MPFERSAGAIIFRRKPDKDKIYYLLLHYPSSAKAKKDYWDFPKGHIEEGEKEIETVKREIKEETNLENIKLVEGFKEKIRYFFKFKGKTVFKVVTFYLAESKENKVKVSFEHLGYQWLPYREAIKKLTFKNAKEILTKANNYLKSKRKIS